MTVKILLFLKYSFHQHMQKKTIWILLFVLASLNAQQIKTIQLRPLGENNFSAIVPLGSILKLSFDDLDADSKEYKYKI